MHIAITGNIGAGKTTLAEKLAKHYGWEVYYEAVDGNPYLPPFYDDMTKWAFHLQIFFLNTRFEQVLKIKEQSEKTIIQDRTIYEDAYIFAKNLYEGGHMNETDFETYEGLFQTIMRAISPPDLMIYLKAGLPRLQKGIRKRGREYEQNMDPDYLLGLNKLYESFAKEYHHGKFLEIDVNDIDFVENPEDFKKITDKLEKTINIGTQLEF
jgi:deoxyadenosine/deoxycytidine kinase